MALLTRDSTVPTAVFRVLFPSSLAKLVKPEELAQLREIEARTLSLRAQLAEAGHDAPKRLRKAAYDAYQANPSAENFAKFKEVDSDAPSLHERFYRARFAIKDALRANAAKGKTILDAIRERAAQLVESKLDAFADEEARLCAKVGIPSEGRIRQSIVNLLGGLRPTKFFPLLLGENEMPIRALNQFFGPDGNAPAADSPAETAAAPAAPPATAAKGPLGKMLRRVVKAAGS